MAKQLFKRILSKANNMPIREQMDYVSKLFEKYKSRSMDGYTRTYLHYRSIFCNIPLFSRALLNLASIILIPVLIIRYCYNSRHICFLELQSTVFLNANNKMGMQYDYSDRFPEKAVEERHGKAYEYRIKKYPPIFDGILNKTGMRCWLGLVMRHPLSSYMNLTCLMYLGLISRIIREYRPLVIINAKVEANYTSSFITYFCAAYGIEYELIMHGDIFLNKDMAFVSFARMYIWDKHYEDMFEELHAGVKEYVLFVPRIFEKRVEEGKKEEVFLTYYLSGTGGKYIENVKGITDVLKVLSKQGKIVRVRPHPRWTDLDSLKHLCSGTNIMIEEPKTISVAESIQMTKYATGSYSTVLQQAFYAGKQVVIDDMTKPERFDELIRSKYIMLSKEHLCLSELMKEVCADR